MKGWVLVAGDFAFHGGMDRANLELAQFLEAENPVHVVTHHVDVALGKMPNVVVHQVRRPLGRHLLGQPLLARAGRRWAAHLSREGYRVIVNGGNCFWPDVNWVHCVHSAYPASVTGNLLRRARAKTVHRLSQWSEQRAIRAARMVICNSKRTARDAVELLGADPVRVHVVYLGSDTAHLGPVSSEERVRIRVKLGWDDRPWVGFVGQLGNRVKGFDTLYAAWRTLCREPGWDANLAVIGAGADRMSWESRAANDGLAARVRFLGFRTDVPEIIAGCDALAAPSRYDAYGLAVHEGLCRGVPVVCSRAAGVSERYTPELADMIVTDPESPAELADRLRYWHANRELLAEHVRPLAETLRARTWADMARDIRDIVLGS